MKDRTDHLNPEYTNLIEVEIKLDVTMIREDIKIGLDRIVITTEGETLEVKIAIEIGVGHT